jgi:hypothetical protein
MPTPPTHSLGVPHHRIHNLYVEPPTPLLSHPSARACRRGLHPGTPGGPVICALFPPRLLLLRTTLHMGLDSSSPCSINLPLMALEISMLVRVMHSTDHHSAFISTLLDNSKGQGRPISGQNPSPGMQLGCHAACWAVLPLSWPLSLHHPVAARSRFVSDPTHPVPPAWCSGPSCKPHGTGLARLITLARCQTRT